MGEWRLLKERGRSLLAKTCFGLATAFFWMASGCASREPYLCASGSQCVSSSAAQGVCMPNHACAYPDTSCGSLGLRYSETAGDLASTCVATSASAACIGSMASGIAFNCAVKNDGTVWCWGADDRGQLGDGQPLGTSRYQPAKVALPAAVQIKSVALGEDFACGLASDGTAWCWGGNDTLQLGQGDADTVSHNTPLQLTFPGATMPIKSISAGGKHACAIDSAESVWCWGENDHDQAGQERTQPCPGVITAAAGECQDVAKPTPVSGLSASFVVVGDEFSCAIDDLFELRCWGDNSLGELGLGAIAIRGETAGEGIQTAVPQKTGVGSFLTVDASNGVPVATAGAEHACVASGGAIHCWGSNGSGQVGTGTRGAPETAPKTITTARFVVSGPQANHSCTIDSDDGELACWGNNQEGEIGLGTADEAPKPTILPMVAVNEVTLGDRHTCAMLSEGTVYCWGANEYGQLGLPPSGPVLSPTPTPIASAICH